VPDYTPKYQFPSPLLSEPPDGPKAVKDLATAVEATIASLPKVATGWNTLVWTAADTAARTVTFPAGRFTAIPAVTALLASNTTFSLIASVGAVSTTGCTVYGTNISHLDQTSTQAMTWMAVSAP
jgi:hypothetical protein